MSYCGCCGQPATGTRENEGYSDCCNDRIVYGKEAIETLRAVGLPVPRALLDAIAREERYDRRFR